MEGRNAAGERVRFARRLLLLHHAGPRPGPRHLCSQVPAESAKSSDGCMYRDFITVGLLVSKLTVTEKRRPPLKDNWIYIQEPDVLVGRLQIFNNWSPASGRRPDKVWIGLEYFCNDTDDLWKLPDERDDRAAPSTNRARSACSTARTARRLAWFACPRPIPPTSAPTTASTRSATISIGFENLFLVGRNGMHKYNNQDHSMLTAMTAVDNIVNGVATKTTSGPSTRRWNTTKRSSGN